MYNFLSLIRFILLSIIQSFFSEYFYEAHIMLEHWWCDSNVWVWLCIKSYIVFQQIILISKWCSMYRKKTVCFIIKKTVIESFDIYSVNKCNTLQNLTKEVGDLIWASSNTSKPFFLIVQMIDHIQKSN